MNYGFCSGDSKVPHFAQMMDKIAEVVLIWDIA